MIRTDTASEELQGLVIVPDFKRPSGLEGQVVEIAAFPLGNLSKDIAVADLETLNEDYEGNLEIMPLKGQRFIVLLNVRVWSAHDLNAAVYDLLQIMSARLNLVMGTIH